MSDPYLEAEASHLTKEQIFTSTSGDELLRWHRALYDIAGDVQAKIEAYRAAGTAEEDWVRRAAGKVAVTKRAMRYVERRCVEIGIDRPVMADSREREEITHLRSKLHEENKGETRRIIAFLKAEFPNSDRVAEAIARIGAGEHRRQEAA